MNPVIEQMHAHRSVRRYADEPVPDAAVVEAVRAGQMASSSSALQAYAVIRVRDAAARSEIAELAGPQEKVVRCGAFLVVCADTRRHRLLCRRAGASWANTFENFLVGVVDASLFAQNLALAFESMGFGVCYVGGVRNNLPRVRDLLRLPEGVFALYGLCVGVPAEEPMARPRLDPDAVLFDDAYPDDDTLLAGVERYDGVYRAYLAERGATARGWSDAVVATTSSGHRGDAGAFYASQGARLG